MKTLNKEEIRKLNEVKSQSFISIYIPTHRSGEAVNNGNDIIVFKNQVQKIKNELLKQGMSEVATKDYLQEAYKLIDDTGFWRYQSDGLAVFIADDFFTYYTLPYAFEDSTTIANAFNLKDLMPVLQGDGHYYILTLSLNKVGFFEATKNAISKIDLPEDIPQSLEEGMRFTEIGRDFLRRDGSTGGMKQAVYHGQGSEDQKDELTLEDYLRDVAKAVFEVVKEKNAPMVLYGAEKVKFLYRTANLYPHLLEKSVEGNPDEVKPDQIQKRTWEIVRDIFNTNRDSYIEKYDELAGTGKTSYDLAKIIPAAANGRIDALFVARAQQVWGKLDTQNQTVEVHESREEGDYCLINKAAIDTFLHGGQVFTLDKESLPEYTVETDAVAIMRF